jgi:GC-rich sequence DNA-binding factor
MRHTHAALGGSESIIPSDSSIKVAREKRERLRKTGISGEDDFISLSVVRRSEESGPHPESRLVREEDELGEGDDGLYNSTKLCLLN